MTLRQHLHGVPDPSVVDPDAGEHDRALYPKVHEWLRLSKVPVLAVWRCNDEIFGPAGAAAFLRDALHARAELLDGGHFLLESRLAEVAGAIVD